MSKRKSSALVKDILRGIDHLQTYTSNLSFETFSVNFLVVEACLYNIQVIGEAAAKIDQQVKQGSPNVPWVLMKDMRNRLIHEYFGTDLELVWTVIHSDLPSLKTELQALAQTLEMQGE